MFLAFKTRTSFVHSLTDIGIIVSNIFQLRHIAPTQSTDLPKKSYLHFVISLKRTTLPFIMNFRAAMHVHFFVLFEHAE